MWMMLLKTTFEESLQLVVGISDAKFSTDPNTTLVTYALGSCLGLTIYDGKRRFGGMLHCLLPLSMTVPEKERLNPYMFVDTGVARLDVATGRVFVKVNGEMKEI
jgi:chemotaxis receptor (MCP) glutamine deamidase CheD